MASILKVDTLQDQAGNNIISESANVITIGASGDNITIPSGATFASVGIDDNATSTAITIDSSENVGIGETSPEASLHINSGTTNATAVFESTDANSIVWLKDSGGATALDQVSGSLKFSTGYDTSFSGGSEAMRIDSSGNVGIGTSSPSAPLHIAGTSSLSTEFKIGNSTWNTSNSNSGLLHQYNSSTGYSELQINSVSTSGSSAFTVRNSTGVAMNFTNDGASNFNGKLTVNDTIKTNDISNRTSLQGVDATPDDANRFELGGGYLNLYRDDTAEVNQIQFGKNGTLAAAFSTGADYLAIKTNGDNERMRIDSSGNVAIGTTDTSHVGYTKTLNITSSNNTAIALQGGTSGVNAIFFGDGTGNPDFKRGVLYYYHSDNSMRFRTNDAERMRIDSSGNVGIGLTNATRRFEVQKNASSDYITSFQQLNSGGFILELDYPSNSPDNNSVAFLVARDSTTNRCIIWSDGDLANHDGVYGSISDERIKQDVVDSNSQWDDIKAVRVRNFKKKDDVRQYGEDAKNQIGVIAQELETVSPRLIKHSDPTPSDVLSDSSFGTLYEDGDVIPEGKKIGDVKEVHQQVKSVSYSILYMKSVKALQEAMERIETLEAKVQTLENNQP